MKLHSLMLLVLAAIGILVFFYFRHIAAKPATQEDVQTAVTFVFVKIPESIMPIERGDKYEDPLDEALKKAGLGEVTGGGSQLGDPNADGSPHIEWVGIDVDLLDLSRGLPFLRGELKRLGAPQGTTLEFNVDGVETSEPL
jgi:hypothetical protein